MSDLRERLARAMYARDMEQVNDTTPWEDSTNRLRAVYLGLADACLAVLAAEPVSEEAVRVGLNRIWSHGNTPLANYTVDQYSERDQESMRAALTEGIRAWLGVK